MDGSWKMKLSSVRPKALRRASTASANTSNTSTSTPNAPVEDSSPTHSRHRISIFRSLRRHSSKQKLAPDQSSPITFNEDHPIDPPAEHPSDQARSSSPDTNKKKLGAPLLPKLLIEKSKPSASALVSEPSTASTNLDPPPTREPLSRSRPSLPRSPLRYSRTPSPVKRVPHISEKRASAVHFEDDSSHRSGNHTHQSAMSRRRIWVRRPGATPTQVHINEDDLVDDVKDMILRKYGNSIGRNFDSPDVTIRLIPRERNMTERPLGPDEQIGKTLDACFPGGQTIEEALLIDVPPKRTPKPSPRLTNHATHYFEDHRPVENGSDYFPPMPAPSPGALHGAPYHSTQHPHSIAILETGQVPPLPSPGGRKTTHRPRMGRTHTSSPTILGSTGQPPPHSARTPARSRRDSDHQRPSHTPAAPPLPTPPTADGNPSTALATKVATPPIDRVASPRPQKPKRSRRQPNDNGHMQNGGDHRNNYNWPGLPPGILDNSVPPINVLIVEDNIINLKLLEQLARKLKIRWSTAMNGQIAVEKWRTGGFHLVLMDIQLPIMNGLEATKEIRRLERLNGIAVFARSGADDSTPPSEKNASDDDEDTTKLTADSDKLDPSLMIKSPVIIVALTASSLQSDRHEALAAGCNDFLTKPVDTVWFERKVMEWGCMQALIDFEGWRKWKDLSKEQEREQLEKEKNMSAADLEKKRKKEARKAALLAKMGQA
ncbi:hypothetical protein FH972_025052 [Carpinus fangiana]|uniref:histidine kinase n=1 Tax=Carpinus fangiana TaxID=176857 RepID=A0A5N6L0G3_9ROSI|nr:hypothetical protein FH972_025052 [Carpinus fangiana]